MADQMQRGGPLIDSMQRFIYSTRHLMLHSYVTIPTYTVKPKSTVNRATANTNWLVGLTLSIKVWNKTIADTGYDMRSIFIVENKRFDVLYGLKEALGWFDTTKYPDLYVINDNNELEFNFDYKELYKLISLKSAKRNAAMIVTPGIINIENEQYEGVMLYVNTRSVWAELTIYELESLIDAIDRFDYQIEPMLNLMALMNGFQTVNRY